MFAWLLLTFLPRIEPFLSTLEKFIVAHWKEVLVALLIGMLAYQNFSSHRFVFFIQTIPYLEQKLTADEAEIKQLKDDLHIAADANAKLTTTIQQETSTVEQWKAVSDKLQKQNDALQGKLTLMRTDNNKKVQSILNAKTPQTCEESIQFLRDETKNLTW